VVGRVEAESSGEPLEPSANGAGPANAQPSGAPPSLAVALVRSLRPRQWVKNLLVFVAPAAAGTLGHGATIGRAFGAFAIFCAVASGMYLSNDVLDIEADRSHPEKRFRPLAAGHLTVRPALTLAAALVGAGLVAAWFEAGWRLTVVMALYAAVSTAYNVWVKYLAVVELASVTSGFVLRAIAGGVATHVPLSDWFLAVTSFGALFIVTGKRFAEYRTLGDDRGRHRPVLSDYTPSFLQAALIVTATASVTTYCLWAFDRTGLGAHPSHAVLWTELTVVPFTIAVLHILRVLDAGGGSAPEELALRDRWLHVFGAMWLLFFLIGIYA
jgi:decaprenyl-phosphate phosphoribosyltransferase